MLVKSCSKGLIQGTPDVEPKPPGPISYARSLPRDKALQREALIAFQMNGRELPQDHGYLRQAPDIVMIYVQ
jgi:DMSO/TMAO reductase YedYZ molybdopterin-dependent catalytic subunit